MIYLSLNFIRRYKKLFFGLILLIGLLTYSEALAFSWRPIVPCGGYVDELGTPQDSCQICHLWQLISNIISFLTFEIAAPLGVLLILGAGIVYITSAGNEQKASSAKSILLKTAIGITIVFASWLLINTLIYTLVGEGVAWAWNEFPTCP